MNAVGDFLAGRSNRLLRDIIAMSGAIAAFSMMIATYISATVDTMQVARQTIPPKVTVAAQETSSGRITTITRSVLDDPMITGSVTGRTLVLDPCTGKEKK